MWALTSHTSSKLAPAVTKKRSSQSLKPNDKHNIYKFPCCSRTLKKCTFCFFTSWFLFVSPRSSLQFSVRNGSLVPVCPQQTGHRTSQRGRMHPAHFAVVVYGMRVMFVVKDFFFHVYFKTRCSEYILCTLCVAGEVFGHRH